ncbi:hypothetical protein [Streptomyces sp. NPDC017890]|uniref:hypothetical protein n=1 Tax=Streptomyces sp. NPDC017890 TaxID=3365015 RepID=UPI003788D2A3
MTSPTASGMLGVRLFPRTGGHCGVAPALRARTTHSSTDVPIARIFDVEDLTGIFEPASTQSQVPGQEDGPVRRP